MSDRTSSVWFAPVTVEHLNELSRSTLMEALGIRYSEVGDDFLRATMPVDHRTVQPAGLLHGGATAALGESVASAAAWCTVDPERFACVGVEINASHLRPVRSGQVTCTARPIRLGTGIQVWRFEVTDDRGREVCTGRLTLAVIAR
jgi:1,4-dihydroxy-2-naphthoyl-CoA hydrolase